MEIVSLFIACHSGRVHPHVHWWIKPGIPYRGLWLGESYGFERRRRREVSWSVASENEGSDTKAETPIQYRFPDRVCSGSQNDAAWTTCGRKWYSQRFTYANLATAAGLAWQSSIVSTADIVFGQVMIRKAVVGGDCDIGDSINYSDGDWSK